MAKRLLRREHIVAASLVGAVVVVIGFASGLGSRPGTGASAAPQPGGEDHPAATAPVTTTQTQAPQGHSTGGGYSGGSGGGGGGAVPVTTAPELPQGTDHIGHPDSPVTTTTPPTSTTPTTPCQPGFVPTAVDTLLGTLGRATDALGLGAAPGLVGTTMAVLPALPEGTPLDQFIATCTASPTTTTTTTTR